MTGRGTKKVVGRAILLGMGIVLLAGGFVVAARARHLQRHLRSAQIGVARLDTALTGGLDSIERMLQDPVELAAFRTTLLGLQSDLAAMESLARPLLATSQHLRWVPWVGSDLADAPHLLKLAHETTSAVLSVFDGLAPIAERLHQEERGLRSVGPELAAGLSRAQPQIEAARSAFQQASQARMAIDASSLSPKLSTMIIRFDTYAPWVIKGLNALEVLPSLLGVQTPKSYLILAQNSDELRATGGFISGVGRVQISRGQVTDISFQDSYAVDNLQKPHPQPPDPLRRYMKAGMLVLRDANWWPDFPTSARAAASLYEQDTGHRVDGVVAVDIAALELLLAVMGPVGVPGYPEPVTTENLHALLMQYWQTPLVLAPGVSTDWWLHRKDYAADLLVALLNKAMDHVSSGEILALAQPVAKALAERHILVYDDEPGTLDLLRRVGWDGGMRIAESDFVMVVDSNVGFNKVNPNIGQTIAYEVFLSDRGAPTAELTLTYDHRVRRPTPACVHEPRYGDSYADLMERCYWDYLRVYVPEGSELVALTGSDSSPDIYNEGGCTVIGTAFLLETGQSRTIRITYRPAISSDRGHYSLLVQKQPGTEAIPLRLRAWLPENTRDVSVRPGSGIVSAGQVIWQGTLSQDLEVDTVWE